MKIRSITTFIPLTWPFDEGTIAGASRFLHDARLRFQKNGQEVQTIRLATQPFMDVVGVPETGMLVEFAQTLETITKKHNIDFVSIGPVIATTPLALLMSIYALPQIITETETIFSGVLLADDNSGINLAAAKAFGEVVQKVAHTTPNGIGNLRLATLANVPPSVPFFPAAYHRGGRSGFALATEAAGLVLETVNRTRSLNEARRRLVNGIESTTFRILEVVDELVDDHQIRFEGIDFSLAPYPNMANSIALAMEKLGLDAFGGHGTTFITAFLTSCIKQAEIPHIGFSGVMLPVLEDTVLAQGAANEQYTVNDLLLYSAVCGTGLDTLPIPGDTTPEQIASIFLDMAAMSVSLHKPLTARLMPIPGLQAGDVVDFDFEYFAKSKVLPVKSASAGQLIAKSSFLSLFPLKTSVDLQNRLFPRHPHPRR